MSTEQRRAHWLRENAAERMPRRVIVLDAEAYRNKKVGSEQHSFRCAVASFDILDEQANVCGQTEWLETESAAQLWAFVADYTRNEHKTVLFAHNLSYDLRLTGALLHLPALGFECKGIALTSFSTWAKFNCRGKSLWLCDSMSFLPTSVERIASALGREKLRLPEDDETLGTWIARCKTDVESTRMGILSVLKYCKSNHLGDFRLTGAAQSSAAFRHRFMRPKTLLVHDDENALKAERDAAWAGRAEVWRHGAYEGTLYEYDYEYAYARLAQSEQIPVRLLAHHSAIPWKRLSRVMDTYSVLANVTVRTETPCIPCRHGKAIVWPVGEFNTVLWDHELKLAYEENANLTLGSYWFYRRAPLLREWATWIMGELDKDSTRLNPVIRYMLKDWSRSLIGRFGLRYSVLDEIAKMPRADLRLYGVHDADNGTTLKYLQLGSQLFEQMAKIESPNSTPAVMSSIMSAARARIWRLVDAIGTENVLYIDTDGIITNAKGKSRLSSSMGTGDFPGLRLKSTYRGGNFRAPRNVDLGEFRRVSGAPKKAERLSASTYRGEVWESLPTALSHGHKDKVFLHERTFNVSDHDPRRVHLPNGATAPLRLKVENGKNVLVEA